MAKSTGQIEMRRTGEAALNKIHRFYFSKVAVTLTPEQVKIKERWEFAWAMLSNMYTRRQVVGALEQKFEVTKSVAYDDVAKCMALFGDPRNANKEAKRAMAEEWIIKGIKKAWDDGDLDAYERLVARFNKINRLEEANEFDDVSKALEKMKAHTIVVVSDPQALQAQAQKLQEELTVDVPHTEL